MSSQRNIVVVGAGPSAVSTVRAIAPSLPANYRLVCIESSHGYHAVAGLRAAVVPGWEEKPVARIEPKVLFPAGSKHIVISGTSVVELKLNSVVLDKPHAELGTEVAFDYVVLATGSSYPFPCRPLPGSTYEETVAALRGLQADIASSTSVLVVGGGPVGIEYAGEVAEHFKGAAQKKKITLVHSHETFLYEDGWKEKLNNSLAKQLKDAGVEVVLGQKVVSDGLKTGKVEGGLQIFELSDGSKVQADFVFVAHGNTPNTSLISSFDPALVNARKQVLVKPSFQVVSKEGKYDHWFAQGDITDVPESKLQFLAVKHGAVVAKNLLALIKAGGPSSSSKAALKAYPPATSKGIAVSVGFKGGAAQFFGFFMGPWFVSMVKSKSLFIPQFEQLYGKTATA
ncbi:hypothetical protein JCM8547_005619 [Rhodosporidiobolus lusitaniae]